MPKLPPTITTKYDRYMKRWIQGGDKAAMLQLLRTNHGNGGGGGGVASYFCQGADNLEPYGLWHGDLVGTYDIVFLAVDHHHASATAAAASDDTNASISRVVKGGTLTLVSKPPPQQQQTGVGGGQQRRLVYGTIQGVTATPSGRREMRSLNHHSHHHSNLQEEEERNVQELSIEFCQAPINPGLSDSNTKFRVTRVNGQDIGISPPAQHSNCNNNNNINMVTSYGILTQRGRFGWSPIETRVDYQEDMDYVEFMQKELEKRYYYGNYKWQEQHSWLCQHMGLPVEAALTIHSFTYHPIPPPYFYWNPGDLLLSIRLDDYPGKNHHQLQNSSSSSSFSSFVYLARPRDPNRLLRKIQDRYPKLRLQEHDHVQAQAQAKDPTIPSHHMTWLEDEEDDEDSYGEGETDDDESSSGSATNSDTDTDDATDVGRHDYDNMDDDDDKEEEDVKYYFVEDVKSASHKRPRHY